MDVDTYEAEEQDPNELVVNVIQARNLKVADKNIFRSGGTSDPFVRLRMVGFDDKTTPYIPKTLTPVWNERYIFTPFNDASLSLEVTVYDHNSMQMKKFLGRTLIPLYDFRDKKPRKSWYRLRSKEEDGLELGELELSINWRYNSEVAIALRKKALKEKKSAMKAVGRLVNRVTGYVDDDDMEEAEDVRHLPLLLSTSISYIPNCRYYILYTCIPIACMCIRVAMPLTRTTKARPRRPRRPPSARRKRKRSSKNCQRLSLNQATTSYRFISSRREILKQRILMELRILCALLR